MSLTPTQKKNTRDSISGSCTAARANEPRIHYSQQRPFPFVDHIGTGWHTLDCSGFVVNCFWNAMHDLNVYIADPSGQKYSGWGSTFTMEPWLKAHGKRVTETNGYLVGDVALYFHLDEDGDPHGHTMICSKPGTAAMSDWTSHGTEGGPKIAKLHYRTDLTGVWRHPALL